MTTGEFRCPICNKLLMKLSKLDLSNGGAIQAKCKCKRLVTLSKDGVTTQERACALTGIEEDY